MRRQRSRDDAAAGDFTDRRDGIEPARRDLPQHSERTDDTLEVAEFGFDEAFDLLTLPVVADDASDVEVTRAKRSRVLVRAFNIAGAGFRRDPEQPIRGAAQRGHDDHRSTPIDAFRLRGHLPLCPDD